jgi:hypothetical protein
VHRDLFEYWGHEASLLPVSSHPLLRWRMDRAAGLEEGWGRTAQVARERPDVVAAVLRRIEDDGPTTAGALHAALDGGARSAGPWWDWSLAKVAVEHLFWAGRVTTATRQGFERVYDLTERVLPAAVLALPVPARVDAQRELVRLAARAHGVATLRDLRDYYRMRVDETAVAVTALVEEGELLPVEVEGWQQPAYLSREARVPRRVPASALLSPFDPLVWERSRASRMFGFDYRIEIYVPAARRVHGYYVLPLPARRGAAGAGRPQVRPAGAGCCACRPPGWSPARSGCHAQALAAELRLAAPVAGAGRTSWSSRAATWRPSWRAVPCGLSRQRRRAACSSAADGPTCVGGLVVPGTEVVHDFLSVRRAACGRRSRTAVS